MEKTFSQTIGCYVGDDSSTTPSSYPLRPTSANSKVTQVTPRQLSRKNKVKTEQPYTFSVLRLSIYRADYAAGNAWVTTKVIIIIVLLLCFETGFLCVLCNSSGCPETHFVDQNDLKLREIHLPLLLSSEVKGVRHHHLTKTKVITLLLMY